MCKGPDCIFFFVSFLPRILSSICWSLMDIAAVVGFCRQKQPLTSNYIAEAWSTHILFFLCGNFSNFSALCCVLIIWNNNYTISIFSLTYWTVNHTNTCYCYCYMTSLLVIILLGRWFQITFLKDSGFLTVYFLPADGTVSHENGSYLRELWFVIVWGTFNRL